MAVKELVTIVVMMRVKKCAVCCDCIMSCMLWLEASVRITIVEK